MNNDKTLVILFGSQTGTAQDLAERIWKAAKSNNYSSLVTSFDKYNLDNLNENTILLCVCSTTGDGVEPDNMRKFWRAIMRRNLPSDCLSMLDFAVIGIGDSSYEKFNFTSKKLFKRLIQLSAKPMLDLCLCDEQHSQGIEGAYSKWISQFWEKINFKINKSGNFLKYKILFSEQQSDTESLHKGNLTPDELNPFRAKLIKNDRVTDLTHWQNTRLIELEFDPNLIKYEPGDVLMLRPSNTKQTIEKFKELFSHLNLNWSQAIRVESNCKDEFETSNETSATLIQTVGDLVEKYFDLNSVPRMSFFETFEQYSTDELEQEKLREFLSPDGGEDLNNYCYRARRTILEVFFDFPKTTRNIPVLDALVDLIPSIKPRSFSIASSPHVHQNRIQILVAVVEYKTRLHETRKGTCSYWLSQLNPEDNITIPIWIKKGSFSLDWSKPMICIGPGTGVAPFRSILNERIYKHNYKENHLYFGCRSKLNDYYFQHEWLSIQQSYPENFYLNTAFSRDQQEKIYVQDLLLLNAERVFDLIDQLDAYILIAGNSKRMPQDVLAYLEKIVRQNLNLTDEAQAKEYIKNLQSKKRIQMETWS